MEKPSSAHRDEVRSPTQLLPPSAWETTLGADHQLVGKIWDVARQRFVSETMMVVALRDAHYVLLGEKHDNPDHHHLQARVLQSMVGAGRRPAVAFEMVTTDVQAALTQAANAAPNDPDGLANAVHWSRMWPAGLGPSWPIYRPVVAFAMREGLPLIAGRLPESFTRSLSKGGEAALDEGRRQSLGLAVSMPDPLVASLSEELIESHCGHLPASAVGSSILVQRAWDGQLALSLREPRRPDGAVLIAGSGHVRRDRGVPFVLLRDEPHASIVSIAWVEVVADRYAPREYASFFHATELPFDFVWFTPRVDDADPCQAFRTKN